jgi:hypothetical protein
MSALETEARPRILRGARAIGEYIDATEDVALHLIKTGKIPAKKIGKCWSASTAALDALVPQAPEPEPDPTAQTAPARARRWAKRKLHAA